MEIRTSSTRLNKYLWHNYCEFWSDIIFVVFKLLFFLNFIQGYFLCTRLENNIWIQVQNYHLFIYFLNQKSYYQKYKICLKFYFHFRECTRSDVRESRRKTGICVVRKEGKRQSCCYCSHNISILIEYFYDKFSWGVIVH